jgi:hypothetical protein
LLREGLADLEAIGQPFEDSHHLLDGPHLGAADNLPCLAEHTDGDPLAVDIKPDVKHQYLLKSGVRENFDHRVSRYPTDRGFLHSFTPTRAGSLADASVDPTEAG